ncbi:hypothetical protein AVEN_33092-1 [Araneus ventricosus]|uniref:Uncharacterized protein n=1 Tax=Araneus ventricosus TaxID=182803 RepID=A0A4Y2CWY4_ARAVE|nr:hypothetical protein AVEN_33092-1 [Araneus ventricosus]
MKLVQSWKSPLCIIITANGVTPVLPKHPGTLNDSLCNSSRTEAGVLMAITRHGSTRLEGGSYYLWRRGNSTSIIIIPQRGARTRLLILRLLIHILVVPPDGICIIRRILLS